MKKVLICIIVGVTVFGIGIVPQRILSGAEHYTVITPRQVQYQPELSCNGTILAEEGIKLLVNTNVIITELRAENGSWVEAGQVVAVTEPPAPEEAFLSQSIDIPGIASMNPQELSGLAAQYGVELPDGALPADLAGAGDKLAAVATAREAVAPISGIITWNSAEAGRFVPAGSQLCTILGMDNYQATVQVPADDAGLILPGALAVLEGSEIGHQQYTGTVLSVGNTITRGVTAGGYNSTIEVKIAVDAPADAIRHGANVSCTIMTGDPEQLLTLPYEAIHQDEKNREFIWLVENGKLKKQMVKTGLELDECIQVLGIRQEQVVALGGGEKTGGRFMLDGGPGTVGEKK